MKLRRIFWWIGVTIAVVVGLFGVAVALLFYSLERHWRARPEPTEIIAKAQGWPYRRRPAASGVEERLGKNPGIMLGLIQSGNPAIRSAAIALLDRVHPVFGNDQLDQLVPLIPKSSASEQRTLLRVWWNHPHALVRLVAVFEHPEPLPEYLRAILPGYFRGSEDAQMPPDPRVSRRLLEIARNPSFPLENRESAIAAIGYCGTPAEALIPEMEEVAAASPPEFGGSIRIAISRLRNTPDPERLADDIVKERLVNPYSLHWLLREIAGLGPAAHDVGPEIVKELRPIDSQTGAMAALALGHIGYREAIPDLVAALHNKDDHEFVAAAAEALGRLKADEAEPGLQAVAASHWNEWVRNEARTAIEAIHGRHVYGVMGWNGFATSREEEAQARAEFELLSHTAAFQEERMREQKWWRTREFFDGCRLTWVRLTSPVAASAKLMKPDGSIEDFPLTMLPRYQLRFAGGTLLGYDQGEFGAGLVFVPKKGEAQYFPIEWVRQFIRWKGGVLVVTDDYDHSGRLHLVRADADGRITVHPFKRMPSPREPFIRDHDGGLRLSNWLHLNSEGAAVRCWVRLTIAGDLELIEEQP
jgi:hypothetical protein